MNKRLFLLFSFVAMSGALLAASLEMLEGGGQKAQTAISAVAETATPVNPDDGKSAKSRREARAYKAPAVQAQTNAAQILTELHPPNRSTVSARLYDLERPGFAGHFLASHHAQTQYDWEMAATHLDHVLQTDADNMDLLRRAMILNMGTGNLDKAAARAQKLMNADAGNSLARLIIIVKALKDGDDKTATAYIGKMTGGDISNFIRPMLAAWVKTGQGKLEIDELTATSIHMYSAALMAIYRGKNAKAQEFARHIVALGRISPYDAERAADIFAYTGAEKEAVMLYEGALTQDPGNQEIQKKLAALKGGKGKEAIKPLLAHMKVESPLHGAAVALYDMARVLYQEQSDSSAKLFAQMALALNPDYMDAQFLMANTMARNERYDEAIRYFSSIMPGHPSYLTVQRHVADLMLEARRKEDALALLNHLFAEHNDIESLIRIGDIHRNHESYTDALQAYNKAAGEIGETIPEQYWHLLYARGMTYERGGDWAKAEKDLKAALAYRPDHPYLLNYLGYGWADQGINLEESLALIERAVALRPTDAYITDSLGWVLYMLARFEEAIPHLEKAVELMPYDPTLNDHLGDAYWQVGRRLEARFQWERAMNNSDDPSLKTAVSKKIASGLDTRKTVREAKTQIEPITTSP